MKFNLRYNPHKNKTLPKIKKISKLDQLKRKICTKTEIYNKNRKTSVDFAMAPIGHHRYQGRTPEIHLKNS